MPIEKQEILNQKQINAAVAQETARIQALNAANAEIARLAPLQEQAQKIVGIGADLTQTLKARGGESAERGLQTTAASVQKQQSEVIQPYETLQGQLEALSKPITIPSTQYGKKVGTTTEDNYMLNLVDQLQKQLDAMNKQAEQARIDAQKAAEEVERQRAENAIAVLTERFNKYGLGTLVPKIRELAIGGATESTITLQLQETEEYKQRFKANQERIKKGLTVLSPGEYLGLEDSYRQVLRAYGLKTFDSDEYVSQFIANDVSTAELSSRVVTAVQRVQNADPSVLSTLRDFYGIGNTDLVAYVLDPNQQFPKIERQVAAAEIGAAARLQGLEAGVAVSEQLAAQGITQAEAQKGYATIADILPTSEKLSQIYSGVLDEYGIAEAEQEVFNSLASAQRKRRSLAAREVAAFSGSSGLGRTSLGSAAGGQI